MFEKNLSKYYHTIITVVTTVIRTIIASIDLDSHRNLVAPSHRVDPNELRYNRHFEFIFLHSIPIVVTFEHLWEYRPY